MYGLKKLLFGNLTLQQMKRCKTAKLHHPILFVLHKVFIASINPCEGQSKVSVHFIFYYATVAVQLIAILTHQFVTQNE